MNKTDHQGRPFIAITGIGIVSSLGIGVQENWRKLIAGISGIQKITRFPTDGLKTHIAGTVDFLEESMAGASALSEKMALLSACEAISQAKFNPTEFGGKLFLASPPVELDWNSRFAIDTKANQQQPASYEQLLAVCRARPHPAYFHTTQFGYIGNRLKEHLGATGLPITVNTACASGATAIQMGVESLRRGETNRALVIATDGSVSAESLIRFSLLSALSTQNTIPEKASKPFSRNRDGFVMAEGAGALLMEPLELAEKRGAKILAILAGCGETADDFHRTRSKPDSSPAIGAIKAALIDSGLDPADIDYVNAHGTSTPENEKMEYYALHHIFGERLINLPVSANKSIIGHTLTAAGAIEAIFSILTLEHNIIPPTINYDEPDPAIILDVVPNKSRNMEIHTVLSNSFGFGGQNTSLIIRKYSK